jgi:hypothetical protein
MQKNGETKRVFVIYKRIPYRVGATVSGFLSSSSVCSRFPQRIATRDIVLLCIFEFSDALLAVVRPSYRVTMFSFFFRAFPVLCLLADPTEISTRDQNV